MERSIFYLQTREINANFIVPIKEGSFEKIKI